MSQKAEDFIALCRPEDLKEYFIRFYDLSQELQEKLNKIQLLIDEPTKN